MYLNEIDSELWGIYYDCAYSPPKRQRMRIRDESTPGYYYYTDVVEGEQLAGSNREG